MSTRSGGRIFWGLVLVILGGLFLLDELDVVSGGELIGTYWPSIIIALGLWGLWTSEGRNLGSVLLVLVGATLQIGELDLLDTNVWNLAWPVALIVIGVWLIVRRPWEGPGRESTGRTDEDHVELFALMSGRNERILSRSFRGGEATAIMGGIELHFDEAVAAEDGANLQLTAIMGGIEVFVPSTWDVRVQGTPIIGAVEDNRRRRAPQQVEAHAGAFVGAAAGEDAPIVPPRPGDTTRRSVLRIDATAIMGGIEIKDA